MGNKIVWTTMLSACGVVFLGFMAWMTSMNSKIVSIEAATTVQALADNGRISVLETVVKNVDVRLGRIEGKMDTLIDRWPTKGK